MHFDRLRRNWEQLGSSDPMWAVLTQPGTRGGGWVEADFYRTGEEFVAWLGSWLGLHGIAVPKGPALDFGCGVGRLTFALAPHFESVTGVDVSAPMVAFAREHNRCGDRVRFVCNPEPDLRCFADGSFAFALTAIVLQHMRSDYALGYLRELLRVLRPGGLLFCQMATAALRPGASLAPVDEVAGEALMEIHAVPQRDIEKAIAAGGGELLKIEPDRWAGEHWDSAHFAVGRR